MNVSVMLFRLAVVVLVMCHPVKPSAAESNILFTAVRDDNRGVGLEIRYPDGFTNRLDLFASTNLMPGSWLVLEKEMSTAGTNVLAWVDTGAGQFPTRFYLVGNAGVDTDSDGVPDARESLVYRTNPAVPDTDSDGIPDGAELLRGTDPVNGGSGVVTLYVDSDSGDDANDGLAGSSGAGHGPKRSIGAAYAGAYSQDSIRVQGATVFVEPMLCLGAQSVVLCPQGVVAVRP